MKTVAAQTQGMQSEPYLALWLSLVGDRPDNQDRCTVLKYGDTIVLALADGLGGHPRGEVAAQMFVDICESRLQRAELPLPDPLAFIDACMRHANDAAIAYGERQRPRICPRSTAVICVLQHGAAWWGHIGDSRLYFMRHGEVLVRTRDHSRTQAARQADGGIASGTGITRCLGGYDQPPAVSMGTPTALQAGDTLLLCSDGLWGQLPHDELLHLFTGADLRAGLLAAVERAAGHPHSDNITAVALRWGPRSRTTTPAASAAGMGTDG
jgi:serine/threonine protein phosphatase PrpC